MIFIKFLLDTTFTARPAFSSKQSSEILHLNHLQQNRLLHKACAPEPLISCSSNFLRSEATLWRQWWRQTSCFGRSGLEGRKNLAEIWEASEKTSSLEAPSDFYDWIYISISYFLLSIDFTNEQWLSLNNTCNTVPKWTSLFILVSFCKTWFKFCHTVGMFYITLPAL